ncbi:MAG: prenyltransferase/squalene oxidase repeat-containing protein [Planctomycetota bacterium]
MRATVLLLLSTAASSQGIDARIGEGVRKGVDFLLSKFDAEKGYGNALGTGTYGNVGVPYPYDAGPTALVSYALLKAAVPRDHPTLKKAFSMLKLRHRTPAVAYELSVMLLAVAERAGAATCPDFRRGPLRQERTVHRFKKPEKNPFPKEEWTWVVDLARKLMSFQSENGGWRYYPHDRHSGGRADVSSTQFALLALSTANRCGVLVPDEVFRKARDYLLLSQEKEGLPVPRAVHVPGGDPDALDRARGFPYIAGSEVIPYRRVSGGMTAAGVASLILLREELGPDEKIEKAILDGYAWIGRYFCVEVNPGAFPFLGGSYHFVWLYALERCGDLGRRELIGDRAWFFEGANHLLSVQREDGAFVDETCMNPQDVLGTAFALLFLTRAHKPVSGGD